MNDYLETFMRRHRLTWLWALAGALGINLALFALMPHLQKPATVGWTSEQPLADINFIRIKKMTKAWGNDLFYPSGKPEDSRSGVAKGLQ